MERGISRKLGKLAGKYSQSLLDLFTVIIKS